MDHVSDLECTPGEAMESYQQPCQQQEVGGCEGEGQVCARRVEDGKDVGEEACVYSQVCGKNVTREGVTSTWDCNPKSNAGGFLIR